jgi:transposase
MEYFAGIDVSLEASSLCLVDSAGKIIRETKVASEPDALVEHFASMGIGLDLIGFPAI